MSVCGHPAFWRDTDGRCAGCGAAAQTTPVDVLALQFTVNVDGDDYAPNWYLVCPACGALGPDHGADDDTPVSLWQLWNEAVCHVDRCGTQPPPGVFPPPTGLRRRLVEVDVIDHGGRLVRAQIHLPDPPAGVDRRPDWEQPDSRAVW